MICCLIGREIRNILGLVCIDDDFHCLFGISDGSDFIHDFLFADGGIHGASADKTVEQLLPRFGLPTELANQLAEQRPVGSWNIHVNALKRWAVYHILPFFFLLVDAKIQNFRVSENKNQVFFVEQENFIQKMSELPNDSDDFWQKKHKKLPVSGKITIFARNLNQNL